MEFGAPVTPAVTSSVLRSDAFQVNQRLREIS
jgi:hypothetical protein